MNWGHGVIPPDTTNTNAGGGVFFSGPSLAHSLNLASSTFAGPKSIDANFNVTRMGTATVADATRRLTQSARDTEIQMLHQQLSAGREALAALSRQDQATASVGGTSLNESVSSAGPTRQRVRLSTQVGTEVETTPKHPRREEFLAKGRRAAVAKKVSDQQEDNLAAARTRIAEQKAKDADSLNP